MTNTTINDKPQILRNNPYKVAFSSMIGTAIEFYDYYIYAAAAVLVFNNQFFDKSNPAAATLLSLSTLALAFIARPIGSVLFGHFGDKIGRKKTLVASLMLMGFSTVAIGFLPNYETIGLWAPILLSICRIGQGLGLGGEWGGAALVAVENAPDGKRAWFGTFPQLGAPIGLFAANGVFFLISYLVGYDALVAWGWRIPFILSFVLVIVGLWMRLTLNESNVYRDAQNKGKVTDAPIKDVFVHYWKPIVLGTFMVTSTYALFYVMTAFAQVYSKSAPKLSEYGHQLGLGIPANTFTGFLMLSAVVFGVAVSFSGVYADKLGRRQFLLLVNLGIIVFAFLMPLFLTNGTTTTVLLFLLLGMTLIGLVFGPIAALLPELFPTQVRYSGACLAYNFASILGASVATIVAIKINQRFGITGVGVYLAANCVLSGIALLLARETKDKNLNH